jgi:16S rRNA (cytosine967-C5)-methyltransferase
VNVSRANFKHAEAALAVVLNFSGPADEVLSRYFRARRELGQRDRAFVAESVFAVLRRKRSLESVVQSTEPRLLLVAALLRVMGLSGRALDGLADEALISRVRAVSADTLPAAVRADMPDWLWERLVAQQGAAEAAEIARGLLNPAPLDLRVNLARISRDEALARLEVDAASTPYSPSGIRLAGKPAINRHPLFRDGLVEVQDEGSQLLAWLLAPRRGEMVADFCAGAGGKTLAIAMLTRGTGRVYALDVSAKRLAALGPRAARAGITNVYSIALEGESDPRAKRLSGKLDRVLVDAPCSGFGTLRRNPDLKWRHGPQAVSELAQKQGRILAAASQLVRPGGRLVYATCSILREENEAVVEAFQASYGEFVPLPCGKLLAEQRIGLDTGEQLRLWPHRHGTDGFFAAAFRRAA